MKIKTIEEWKESIQKYSDKEELRLRRSCEWIVLRPNDEIYMYGEENFKNKVMAVEQILNTEKYINSDLRKYYYDMKNHDHSLHDFDRWKIYGRKIWL